MDNFYAIISYLTLSCRDPFPGEKETFLYTICEGFNYKINRQFFFSKVSLSIIFQVSPGEPIRSQWIFFFKSKNVYIETNYLPRLHMSLQIWNVCFFEA